MARSRAASALLVVALTAVMLAAAIGHANTPWLSLGLASADSTTAGYLHSAGSKIVDASGREVHLTGVNWVGFESGSFAPHGLDVRNYQGMLDQMARAGFNTLRLPYSNQLFAPGSVPTGINYTLNPDLKGLRGLALLDKIVQGAARAGLKVILDRHQSDSHGRTYLWYTDQVPESRWIHDWVMLARHYRGNTTVIGADLHNEPRNPATWGGGVRSTDWRLAAERAGNAILKVNPDWLIIVEGIETYHGDSYWWGGNLEGAERFPVRLSHPEKLVYSAHDYGPQVWPQTWFYSPTFPHNLPAVWLKHWAYLQMQGIAPVYVGEFGGYSVGQDADGLWQRSLVVFLAAHGMSYAYWSWTPDTWDTGGILESDWRTLDGRKLLVLSTFQRQLLGEPAHEYGGDVLDTYQQP